jgi:uncharacterized protein (DUF58 family)
MRWLLLLAIGLTLSLVLQSGLLAYALYVLIGLTLIVRYIARAGVDQLAAVRVCPTAPQQVGNRLEVRVQLTNTGPVLVPWILLEDLLPASALRVGAAKLKVTGKRLKLVLLWPGASTTVKYTLEFLTRGYHQIGPLVLEGGDLFGLHRRHRVLAPPVYVQVFPPVVPLTGYDIASRRPVGEVRLLHRLYEDPTRHAGIRPYQPGDPLQRVHWRATARTGELHCKLYDPTTLAGVSVLLDLADANYPPAHEPYRSDLAVQVATAICHAVSVLNQPVGLASNARDAADRLPVPVNVDAFTARAAARDAVSMNDASTRRRPVLIETRRGVEQFGRIHAFLARAELSDGLSFAQLVNEVRARLPRSATALAILTAISAETAVTIGSLRRSGFAVSVVLVGVPPAEREEALGRLLAEGVRDVRFVNQPADLAGLCQPLTARGSAYAVGLGL